MTSEPVRLLDLPNEILLAIWNAVLPNDIENFANTCRHLHLLGVDVLEEHKSWKTAHSHISLGEHPASTLVRYYGDLTSRISYYPTRLTAVIPMHDWAKNDDDYSLLDRLQLMAAEKRGSFLSEKIISSLDASCRDRMAGMLTAILARCLPNLETIFYIEHRLIHRNPGDFVFGLINGFKELITFPVNPQDFPRLSHFSITKFNCDSFPSDLAPFLQVLVLPNLRSFEASKFSCRGFDSLPFHPRTSRVETLDIDSLECSRESILTLLSAFEALKSFKLCVIQIEFQQVQRFFSAVHACLLQNFQHSLQRLEIDDGNAIPEFFGSLRSFSVLKSVVIQPDLLMSTDHIMMPRLIDGFPSSIEEIKFTRSLTETQENHFFARFLDEPEVTMPNLRLIISCQFLNWRYKGNSHPGGEYRFRYIKYRDDTVTIQYIDNSAATSQWRSFQLSINDWRGREFN